MTEKILEIASEQEKKTTKSCKILIIKNFLFRNKKLAK